MPTSPLPAHLLVLQNLLVAGHRPIRMRPGSLVRWGLAFALLASVTDPLLRHPALQHRPTLQAGVAMLWLGLSLGLTAWWDWRAAHAAAQQAEETLPFVHTQVSKVWWLLLAAGVLYTGSTIVFGGAYQVYMVWLALVGLGLFLHGLFAQEPLEWAGAGIFLLAILVLASGLPLAWHRPIVISTAGLGMPLLGWLLHRQTKQPLRQLPLAWCTAAVLAASVLPAMAATLWGQRVAVPDDIPLLSVQDLHTLGAPAQWPHYVAVHLQAGSPITLELDIQGGVLRAPAGSSALSYTVQEDLDLLLVDGSFSHLVRRAGQDWQDQHGWLRITQLDFTPDLATPQGLKIRSSAHIELGSMP
jgi:hypothetical protein